MTEGQSESRDGGWVVFAAMGMFNTAQGLLLLIFGGEVVQESFRNLVGVPWAQLAEANPAFTAYVNDLLMILGLFLAAFGLLVVGIAITGYRRKRPWAWYIMWTAPAFYLMTAAILLARGEIYFSDDLSVELFSLLLALSLLIQVAERPSFMARFRAEHLGR